MIFGLAWSKMGMAVYSLWGHKIFCILRMGLWIELIFCKLTVMQLFLVRPTSYSTSLTFKCHSAAVVLAVSRAVAGRIQWNRICSSFCPTTFPIVFYELDHSFLWILSWCQGPSSSCVRQIWVFLEKTFCPKIGELTKNRVFEFKQKFGR